MVDYSIFRGDYILIGGTMSAEEVTGTCVECEGEIVFSERPMVAEIVECDKCSVDLEVLSVDPVSLILAPKIEEDWGE